MKMKSTFAAIVVFAVSLVSAAAIATPAVALPSTGYLDQSFNQGGSGFPSGYVQATAVQPDGKILVGGSSTTYNGSTIGLLTRLNTDGSIDPSFNTGTAFAQSTGGVPSIQSILVLPDGSILVAGNFLRYNSGTNNVTQLVKLSATGVLDTTFVSNLGVVSGVVMRLTLLSTGDIVVGGQMVSVGGVTIGGIFKINPSGQVNTAFNSNIGTGFTLGGGSGALTVLGCVELANNNLMIVGTSLNRLNGIAIGNIAEIQTDGTPVSAVNTELGTGANDTITRIIKQSTGKVVIAGWFSSLKGVTTGRIARLNADGTVDTTFNQSGVGFNGRVDVIALDANDKIIVGTNGVSPTFNGSQVSQLLKLSADGSIDSSFVGAVAGAGSVGVITPETGGDIYVGGSFATYQSVAVNRFMRLTVAPPSISPGSQNVSSNVGSVVTTGPFTATGFSGTITYSISGSLPAGLSIDTTTGVISGQPNATLTATTFTITASDGTRTATSTIQLTILAAGQGSGQNLAKTGMSPEFTLYTSMIAFTLLAFGGLLLLARKSSKK